MNANEPLKKCREYAQSVETTDVLESGEKSAVCYLIAGCMTDGIKEA